VSGYQIQSDSLEELLDSLAERGEITRASQPKRGWKSKAAGLGLSAESVKAILDEISRRSLTSADDQLLLYRYLGSLSRRSGKWNQSRD
jgi:hypothetical protein